MFFLGPTAIFPRKNTLNISVNSLAIVCLSLRPMLCRKLPVGLRLCFFWALLLFFYTEPCGNLLIILFGSLRPILCRKLPVGPRLCFFWALLLFLYTKTRRKCSHDSPPSCILVVVPVAFCLSSCRFTLSLSPDLAFRR